MNSLEDQYGFDASFISEVEDYLKCVVCHLVLREPVQIMQCGHRFCKPCFERIKGYSETMGTDLSCPIDRDIIELAKVFEDTGIARVIGNLSVRCSYSISGCSWTGDLRDMETHEEACEHKVLHVISSRGNEEIWSASILKDFHTKMNSFEEFKLRNEKEMAHLKYTIHDLKNNFNKKDEEVVLLKEKNTEIEKELQLMKEFNIDLKKSHERELENLSLKGQLLEIKVESLGNQVVEMKKISECNCKRTSSKSELKVSEEDKKLDEIDKLKEDVLAVDNKIIIMSEKIEKLTKQVTTSEEAMKDVQDHFNKLDIESDVGEIDTKLQDTQDKFIETKKDIDILVNHISNIENILFCDSSKGSMNIVLKWKLQNYEHLFDLGETVYSPIFYTQLSGYCFQLYVKWCGQKKEQIGIFLTLCRGSDYNKELEPFMMEYTLEIMDTSGSKLQQHIPTASIDCNRERYFTIPAGKDKICGGYGNIFNLHNMNIKNMLLIRCTLMSLGN